MQGRELCSCGHAREHHLQRSREKARPALVLSWVDAERDPKVKLAGCLLCGCEAFKLQRVRPLR
jgi:hypothetical protein